MRNADYTAHMTEMFDQLESPDENDHFLYYDIHTLQEVDFRAYSIEKYRYDRVSIQDILEIKIYDQLHNLRTMFFVDRDKCIRKNNEIEQKLLPHIADIMTDTIQELKVLHRVS